MFQNLEIDPETLPKSETVDLLSIEKAYLKIIIFNICISYLSIILVLSWFYYVIENSNFSRIALVIIPSLILVFLFSLITSVLGFKNRKYALREKDIIYTSGFIKFSTIVLPFNRIQHIELSHSFLERKLGLAILSIYTAGESGSDLTIRGLPIRTAESINTYIISLLNG